MKITRSTFLRIIYRSKKSTITNKKIQEFSVFTAECIVEFASAGNGARKRVWNLDSCAWLMLSNVMVRD